MFSDVFLAQTPAEAERFPIEKTAYMACHFSPYGKGLSNLPKALPTGSIVLLDDSMPPNGHDPMVVEADLKEIIKKFGVLSVLLDFQLDFSDESLAMARYLANTLPCPVAVTERYAKKIGCPVFLSPAPVNMALKNHIAPWVQQGIYLEIAPETVEFTITESGCTTKVADYKADLPLADQRLHCHYNVEVFPEKAVFTLGRTKADLAALAAEAKSLGVLEIIGLYQEIATPLRSSQ